MRFSLNEVGLRLAAGRFVELLKSRTIPWLVPTPVVVAPVAGSGGPTAADKAFVLAPARRHHGVCHRACTPYPLSAGTIAASSGSPPARIGPHRRTTRSPA